MRTDVRCRECGQVFDGALVDGRFDGVCPRCLAKFALATEVDAPSEAALPLKVGATFRGIEIVDVLGRGGMGVVYKARQVALGRDVALKVLAPDLARDPEFVERFNREARALAALAHPNIVAVHEFGREGDLCFLAMEFVQGRSLREVMNGGRLPVEDALRILPQICEALEHAHAHGVVHRDIKPENVLVDASGRVKIADFGLAKVRAAKLATLTRTDVAMGTPQYMAPEQYDRMKDVDGRADIYSLGVMFYEMLTGDVPAGHFDPPSKKARVDARLDPVVLKAMAREPERRYQRAAHVKTDVEAVRARPAVEEVKSRVEEGFTSFAQRAIALAQDEARRLGAMYVGTEHLLLGVLEYVGDGFMALGRSGVRTFELRAAVEASCPPAPPSSGTLALTPAAERSLVLAREAARGGAVGTHHIVLGLVRVGEGIALAVLTRAGLKPDALERAVAEQPQTEAEADTPRWWNSIERPIGLWTACALTLVFSFLPLYTLRDGPHNAWQGDLSGIPGALIVLLAGAAAALATLRARGAAIPAGVVATPAVLNMALLLYAWYVIDNRYYARPHESLGSLGMWGMLAASAATLGFIAAQHPRVRHHIVVATKRIPPRRTT